MLNFLNTDSVIVLLCRLRATADQNPRDHRTTGSSARRSFSRLESLEAPAAPETMGHPGLFQLGMLFADFEEARSLLSCASRRRFSAIPSWRSCGVPAIRGGALHFFSDSMSL